MYVCVEKNHTTQKLVCTLVYSNVNEKEGKENGMIMGLKYEIF